MMFPKTEKPLLQKHTLNLYEGHFERLKEFYPALGASVVIRELVAKLIRDIELEQNRKHGKPMSLIGDI